MQNLRPRPPLPGVTAESGTCDGMDEPFARPAHSMKGLAAAETLSAAKWRLVCATALPAWLCPFL